MEAAPAGRPDVLPGESRPGATFPPVSADPLTIDPDGFDADGSARARSVVSDQARTRHWWRDVAFYPVVVGLVLIIQLMAFNGVGIYTSIRVLVAIVLIGLLASVAFRLVLGDRARAGLATFLFLVAITAGDKTLVWAALACVLLIIVERRVLGGLKLPWPTIGRASRGVAAILCVAVLVQAVQLGALKVFAYSLTTQGILRPSRSFTTPVSAAKPDIYLILLDGYARQDALKQVFGLDETPFIAGLQSRGLSVSSRATTQYATTVQVLMAMFNMQLIQDIPRMQPVFNGTNDEVVEAVVHQIVEQNPLFDTLYQQGYEIDGISSGFADVSLRTADHQYSSGTLNEVELGMLSRSVLGDLVDAVAPDLISSQQRTRILRNLSTAGELAQDRPSHPRFVFVHVPSPHPPWVFNADGSPRQVTDIENLFSDDPAGTGLTEDELKAGYAGAVQAIQDPVLATIDSIEKSSAVPPIIILFGDHGSWVGARPGDARLRFLPLLAAKVPGVARPFADDEALVNVFPDLLKEQFGISVPRIDPAPSFIYPDESHGYQLTSVGDPNLAITDATLPSLDSTGVTVAP